MSSLAIERGIKSKRIAVFGFGRFQPPTKGHEDLINNIIREAADVPWLGKLPKEEFEALTEEKKKTYEKEKPEVHAYLFSSLSENKIEDPEYKQNLEVMMEKNIFCSTWRNANPMLYDDKFKTMKDWQTLKIWPGPDKITIVNSLEPRFNNGEKNRNFEGHVITNVAAIISFLYDRYGKIYFVVGSDRYIKGSFDEFFDLGLLEIISTKRNENVISGSITRIEALQFYNGFPINITETDFNQKLLDFGNKFLVGEKGMERILNPTPDEQSKLYRKGIQTIEFIINSIINNTIPKNISLKDMTIDWESKEHCGKWDFKWSTPDSWDAYWRRGRYHYPTRAFQQAQIEEERKVEDAVAEKSASIPETQFKYSLKKNAPLYKSGIMPEYNPTNVAWEEAYEKKND